MENVNTRLAWFEDKLEDLESSVKTKKDEKESRQQDEDDMIIENKEGNKVNEVGR